MLQLTMLSASAFICCVLLLGLSSKIPEASCAKAVTNLTDVFLKHELHYLNVPNIGALTVYDIFDCTFECLQVPLCISINLALNKGADGKLVCELLSSDKYIDSNEYRANESSHHFSIKSPCWFSPCQNGGTCLANYKDDTFECLCLEGYIGDYCETAAKSCKEIYNAFNFNTSRLVTLRFDPSPTAIFCHLGDFGCGGGAWTLVIKMDGSKNTFHYNSAYWSDQNEYNLPGGETGFDSQETKLPTYWNTSFSKICLGIKIGQQINFIVINEQADSLYSLIADGQYRATSLGRNTWKTLIGSQAYLQPYCNKEGFNAASDRIDLGKARIGFLGNNENDCHSCDSRIGFGTGGLHDDTNTCGNEGGGLHIKAMGYILVQ
ncbi:hypothetical protein ACROYT_G042037 [Oculina patagonica]